MTRRYGDPLERLRLLGLLVDTDWPLPQVGQALGVLPDAAQYRATALYADLGVEDRPALRVYVLECELVEVDAHGWNGRVTAGLGELTHRELDIARAYAESDRTMAEIARERYITVNTANTARRLAYRKLGVHGRDELRRVLGGES